MKLAPVAIAAALLCGSAMAQAPSAAQRAENRAKAGSVVDKATPGPAQRAENRAREGLNKTDLRARWRHQVAA